MRRTFFRIAFPTSLVAGAVYAIACSSTPSNDATGGGATSGSGTGAVGSPCTDSSACRSGLTCTNGACAPGHDTSDGASCTIDDECAMTSYCTAAQLCGPRGVSSASSAGGGTGAGGGSGTGATGAGASTGTTGTLGGADASCSTDGDCMVGFRCVLNGFSATCAAEGAGDVGSKCSVTTDCLGGLVCAQSTCSQGLKGIPPFGLSMWAGETCGDDIATPTAYFRVPRGTDDGDFYRLPFPNDIRTKNGHPDYTGHPTPGSDLLGFDVVQRYLDAIATNDDGFGAYPTVFFRFSAVIDLPSFRTSGAVQWIDITEGAPEYGVGRSLSWDAYAGASKYICKNFMGVRPAMGNPLTPGHTYAVMLANGGTANGITIAQGADFPPLLAASGPSDASLGTAYAAYAPLRGYLASKSIDPSTILNAAVFTVGHVRAPAEKIAAAAYAAPVPTASNWVKCGSGPSPCPDATGDRACGTADPSFDELQALVSLPIFQQGTAPYLTPGDGGGIDTSGATVSPTRAEQVCMALTVPKGAAMPASGWPILVYAHGTGGSFRSHITEGVAKTMATAAAPIAVLGIDQVEHGPRRGMSTSSPDDLFYNFANPGAALGNPLQGAADQVSLGRFASGFLLAAAGSPTGADIAFDPGAVMFWGHSQGATEGGITVPYSKEITGAVLSGEGASLIDSMLNKTQPVNIAGVLAFALQDPDPSNPTKLLVSNFHPVLSILQSYIDPADPLNNAAQMTSLPPDGITGHHVFQPFGMGDSYAPTPTEATYSLAAGLGLVGTLLSKTPADSPVDCMPDMSGNCSLNSGMPSLSGNIKVGMAGTPFTGAVRQYATDGTYDGHFVSTMNPQASADVVQFLQGLAAHQIPTVGP